MKNVIVTLAAVLIAAPAFGQSQEEVINYVALVCAPVSKIKEVVPAEQQTNALDAKTAELAYWASVSTQINAATVIVNGGVANIEKAENQPVVLEAYSACQNYFTIQPVLSAFSAQAVACVDNNDQPVNFASVETACVALGTALEAAFAAEAQK